MGRSRRTLRGAMVVAIVLVVCADVASVWRGIIASTVHGHTVSIASGAIYMYWPTSARSPLLAWHVTAGFPAVGSFTWAWDVSKNQRFGYGITVPLWLVAAGLVVASAVFWHSPTSVHRWYRRRKGLCVACRYPVVGEGGRCPECGSATEVREVVFGRGVCRGAGAGGV